MKPVHILLKERMTPQEYHKNNFASELASQQSISEREVATVLCFQLCFALYSALQLKNNTRSVSAVNPVAMKNTGDKHNSQHNHREATACQLI